MSDRFYHDLPQATDLADLVGEPYFQPLPDEWHIGLAEMTPAEGPVAPGQARARAKAALVPPAAFMNAVESMTLPMGFGGHWSWFAVSAHNRDIAGEALARSAGLVRDDFSLDLRVALVPVAEIRAAGQDVRIARQARSAAASYAMARGGGLQWARSQMAAGRFAVAPAPEGLRPDLADLSARFAFVPARHGLVLSLAVAPQGAETPGFADLLGDLLTMTAASAGCDRPIGRPEELVVAPAGDWLDLETSTSRVGGFPRWAIRLERALFARLIRFVIAGDRKIGLFDARRFKTEVVANAVSASLADGFRASFDCTPALADAIGARLAAAEAAGIARFGLSRQDAALMISFIPHWTAPHHLHFIDGAGGGLGAAERRMLEKSS